MLIDRETFECLAHAGRLSWTGLLPRAAVEPARVAGAMEIPPPEAVPAIASWAKGNFEHAEAAVGKRPRNAKLAADAAMVRAHILAELRGDLVEGNRILNEITVRLGEKPAATGTAPSAAGHERVHHVEVKERDVPPAVRLRAELAMARALVALPMDAPKVRWFRAETASEKTHREREVAAGREVERPRIPCDAYGVARGLSNEMWLAADQPLEEVAYTVAHECAHLFQMQEIPRLRIKNWVTATEAEWMEWDANAFAERFVEPAKPAA